MKIEFSTKDGITMVRGDQQVTRQCLVAAINLEVK